MKALCKIISGECRCDLHTYKTELSKQPRNKKPLHAQWFFVYGGEIDRHTVFLSCPIFSKFPAILTAIAKDNIVSFSYCLVLYCQILVSNCNSNSNCNCNSTSILAFSSEVEAIGLKVG